MPYKDLIKRKKWKKNYDAEWKQKNRKRWNKYQQEWKLKNGRQLNENARRKTANLEDKYIIRQLKKQGFKIIPLDAITAKRLTLKIKRLCQKSKTWQP